MLLIERLKGENMESSLDKYLRDVIQLGDEGSDLLNKICVSTLTNSQFVDVIENVGAVLRIPDDYYVVVHSAGGNPKKTDLGEHTASLVDRLVKQAEELGAEPIAFANVIDSNSGDHSMLETIANNLVDKANQYGLAIVSSIE